MSPRTFVTRGAALVALALGIAACETKTIVSPPPADVVVSVTPATATLNATGQAVQFVALVQGVGTNGNTAVTWKSSNPAAATVSASGNTATVTAVANGITTIIATSVQDPTRSAAATVTVQIGTGGGSVPPTVSIASITTLAGGFETSANTAAIQNTIVITANVDQGQGNTISAVNFNLGGKTVCSQTLTQGKSAGDATVQATSAVAFSCQVKTDSIASGTPVFPNGNYTLTVSVVGPANAQLASASQALTFANTDKLAITFSAANGPKLDASGLAWMGGDLTVKVTPAIFSGAANNVSTVTITVNAIDSTGAVASITPALVTTATGGVYTATFPASKAPNKGGVQGIQTGTATAGVTITATSVTSAGQNGPSNAAFAGPTVFRLDNLAPKVTAFVVPGTNAATAWVNALFTFGSTSSPTNFTQADNFNGVTGVNNDSMTFQVANAADTTASGGWKTVVTGADLAEVPVPTYIVRVMIKDALGNSRIVYGSQAGPTTLANATSFAVDKTPPIQAFAAGSLKTNAASNVALPALALSVQDTGAAPSGTVGIQYKVKQFTSAGTTCLTKNSSGSCVFGANATGTPNDFTTFVSGATTVVTTLALPFPAAGAYDSIYVQTLDVAGNVSSTIAMIDLFDPTLPTAGGVVGPAVLTGGTAATFSTQASDNLDLGADSVFLGYNGMANGFLAGTGSAGTYGLPLETSGSPGVTVNPFITSIQSASNAGVLGAGTFANLVTLKQYDQANNQVTKTLDISANVDQTQAAFTFGAAAPGAQVTAFTVTAANANPVCNGLDPTDTGKVCGTVQTSVGVSAIATGPSGTFANPFVRVNFYYLNAAGQFVLIATSTSAGASDNGTIRTWTYSTTFTPAGLAAATYPVIAIGVDSKGHGLMGVGSGGVNLGIVVQDALQ